jgi:hypothetical protein
MRRPGTFAETQEHQRATEEIMQTDYAVTEGRLRVPYQEEHLV